MAMKTSLSRGLLAACLLAAGGFSIGAQAADDAWREDMLRHFQMDQIDVDHDHQVSRKEFLNRMGQAWDAQARAMDVHGDRMTVEQYRAFAKMFGLDIGRP
jgi:hypothetical protein